jgi:hypothetical protein
MRKRAMVYLWRAQQSGAIISLGLLGTLTAASLYHDFLAEWTNNYGLPQSWVGAGIIITMAIIFAGVFGVGFLFDRLKFWREQNIVAIERNPYGSYKLTAKEVQWIQLWVAAVRAGQPSPQMQKLTSRFEQWIERSVADDAMLKEEVDAIDRWITQGDESVKHIVEDD